MTRDSARIAMDVLPVRSQQFLDRRVRPHVAQMRTTVVDSVVRQVAVGGRARVLHASLLDGHTLNLHAVLPSDEAAGGDEGFLSFVRGRRQQRVPVRLNRVSRAELHADATVPLGPLPGGLDLEPGRWGLRIVLGSAGRPARLFDLEGPLGPSAAGGPTQTPPASPLTGFRYQIRVTPLGLCRITVRRPQPHAEMVRFELRPEGAVVAFRMVGVTRARPVAVEIACGSGLVEVVPTAGDGDILAFAVPFDAMLRSAVGSPVGSPVGSAEAPHAGAAGAERPATGEGLVRAEGDEQAERHVLGTAARPAEGPEQDWQMVVRMRDGSRHPLGRELDVPRMPRRVFRMRTRLVATEGGALVRVRPHYNARRQFRLGCTAVHHARPGVTA
ncbi:hypothetical protein [Streptodolium elevatio]|uniref:Uncharacterized protein n=1 Tax=Streptodolium elevatio TaxID=3157996 RepID=A0ABV3DI50_9ACTN